MQRLCKFALALASLPYFREWAVIALYFYCPLFWTSSRSKLQVQWCQQPPDPLLLLDGVSTANVLFLLHAPCLEQKEGRVGWGGYR
jgi:hypothetical protein